MLLPQKDFVAGSRAADVTELSTMTSRLHFRVEATATGSQARAGRFRTLHGEVQTPLFMPVGTQATVKGLTVEDLEAAGSHVLLANAYHLLLRPGPEVFARLGGIHRFMNWRRLGADRLRAASRCSRSPNDRVDHRGRRRSSGATSTARASLLSPERSIATQLAIGSDIMMAMDQCIPSTSDHATAAAAMHRTHRWAARSLAARGDSPQALFGIVQGACFDDLRRESAEHLTRLPFDGFAIGGLAVGESKAERERFTALAAALLPRDLPRYLMGVGTPLDLLEAVHRGVDMFDCIIPSVLAQAGRGVHVARPPQPVSRRLQARRGAGRCRVPLPDLPRLLARVPAPPDQDRASRSAGSCSPSTTCASTTT